MDAGVYKIAHDFLDCLVTNLTNTRAGAPCVALVHPGEMAPMYGWCKCDDGEGMAWVRVVNIFPTVTFPAPANTVVRPNTITQFGVVLELGRDLCYRTPQDNSMPAPAVLDSATRDVMDDAAAMRKTAWCCLPSVPRVPGMWLPRGPAGAIHGGTMQVTVLADVWCGCDVTPAPLDTITLPVEGDPRFG